MTDHSITMENRELLTVTAVTDVKNFDDESVFLVLQEGGLSIKGKDLKILQLDLNDEGRVVISGLVNSMIYVHSKAETGGSVLKRLLK